MRDLKKIIDHLKRKYDPARAMDSIPCHRPYNHLRIDFQTIEKRLAYYVHDVFLFYQDLKMLFLIYANVRCLREMMKDLNRLYRRHVVKFKLSPETTTFC